MWNFQCTVIHIIIAVFPLRIHQNRCRLGLRIRAHWGVYSEPPDPLAGFKGDASRQEGNEGERREGLGWVGKGKGGERGKLGNSALVVGGIDAPV